MSKPKAGYTRAQKDRNNANLRAWHKNNPEKSAEYSLRYRTPELLQSKRDERRFRNYGLTPDQFGALLASQSSQCAICATDTPGGRGAFHVDHCHTSLRLRGLLCSNCNTGLGKFKDSVAVLQSAIGYLQKDSIN